MKNTIVNLEVIEIIIIKIAFPAAHAYLKKDLEINISEHEISSSEHEISRFLTNVYRIVISKIYSKKRRRA